MVRRREWQDFIIAEDTVNNGQDIVNLIRGDINETKGMTLIRTIIRLDCLSAAVGGTNGVQKVAMGIGMFSTAAEAVGFAALPDPAVGTSKPFTGWLW